MFSPGGLWTNQLTVWWSYFLNSRVRSPTNPVYLCGYKIIVIELSGRYWVFMADKVITRDFCGRLITFVQVFHFDSFQGACTWSLHCIQPLALT